VTTRTNVVVDFENVQPKDIGLLKDGPFKVKVCGSPDTSVGARKGWVERTPRC
jgi:hypothetical protein